MGILDTPDWLDQYVKKWQTILHLTQWRITSRVALAPNNDATNLASCSQTYNITEATMTFRVDLEENQDWQETILHEMLHISHGTVDQIVWNVGLNSLPIDQKNAAYQAYTDAMEKFVDGVSKVLWQLEHPNSQETNNDNTRSKRPFGLVPQKPSNPAVGSDHGGD